MSRISFFVFFIVGISNTVFSQQSISQEAWNLRECIDYAFENNLAIKRSKLNVNSDAINLSEAKYLRYPTLNFGGQSGLRWGRSIDPTSNQFVSQRIASMGLSGSGAVTIFEGFQINNQIEQSKANLEASRYELEDAKNNLALEVVSSYLNVIFNRELVKNAERQLEVANLQLEQTTKLVEAGAVPLSNQLEIEAQKASYEVEVIRSQNELDLSVLQLKQALLIQADQPFEVETPEIEVDETEILQYTSFQVYENALQNQPVVKSAYLRAKSGELGIKIARGALAPSLSVVGNIFTNYSDAARSPSLPPNGEGYPVFDQFGDNLSQSVALNLSIPILNGFRARSNVQRAEIALQETGIYVEETRQRLRQTIESAFNDAVAASKSYQASLKQVEALEESFRSIQRRYSLGAESFVNFQVSQNNLFNAQYDLLRAKYEYVYRIKVLDFYMGKPLSL